MALRIGVPPLGQAAVPNGLATLDGTGKLAAGQFPTLGVSGVSRTVTSATTILATDHVLNADATGGAFPVTLPTAVGFTGIYFVNAITAGTNLVTMDTTSGQTIGGWASGALTLGTTLAGAPYSGLTLASDGANWTIV